MINNNDDNNDSNNTKENNSIPGITTITNINNNNQNNNNNNNLYHGRAVTHYISGVVREIDAQPFNKMAEFRSSYCDNNNNSSNSNSNSNDRNDYNSSINKDINNNINSDSTSNKNDFSYNNNDNNNNKNNKIRIVSYNILAEPFATSESAVNKLFCYCCSYYLETEYRIQRILFELQKYKSDFICLQECDKKCFDLFLKEIFSKNYYYCCYTNKDSGVLEGCATFVNLEKFIIVKSIDVPLKNILRDADYLEGCCCCCCYCN